MINIYTVTFPVKSLDLVFLDIEIATLSNFQFFKGSNYWVDPGFPIDWYQKMGKNIGRLKQISLKCGQNKLKFSQLIHCQLHSNG